jgi:hypothetical protein
VQAARELRHEAVLPILEPQCSYVCPNNSQSQIEMIQQRPQPLNQQIELVGPIRRHIETVNEHRRFGRILVVRMAQHGKY